MTRPATGRRAVLTGALLASAALALPLSSPAAKTPKSKAPHASTGSARHVGGSSAELTGNVNPRGQETSYYFQYGPTTAYGIQTPTTAAGGGTGGVKVDQVVSGLQVGATYHYRLVAVNAVAETTDGRDRTFTTRTASRGHGSTPKPLALKFVVPKERTVEPYGSPFSLAGTLSGPGGASQTVVLQASPFPYQSPFSDLGSPTTTNARGGFSLRVPSVSQNTKLRVSTLGSPTVYSRVVTVQVSVLVTLRARLTGQGVRFEGTVTPAEAGAPVTIQLLRPGRRPSNVGSTTVTRGSRRVSRFSALVSVRHTGPYRVLVKVSNGRQVSGHSRSIPVQAVARSRRRRR